MITRSECLQSPHCIQDYYLQFANNGIRASVAIYFPLEELRASTSEGYFRDINLSRWRSCARYIRPWLNVEQLKESGDFYSEVFAVNLCKAVACSLIQNS
jgi:hypothetical protein